MPNAERLGDLVLVQVCFFKSWFFAKFGRFFSFCFLRRIYIQIYLHSFQLFDHKALIFNALWPFNEVNTATRHLRMSNPFVEGLFFNIFVLLLEAHLFLMSLSNCRGLRVEGKKSRVRIKSRG